MKVNIKVRDVSSMNAFFFFKSYNFKAMNVKLSPFYVDECLGVRYSINESITLIGIFY